MSHSIRAITRGLCLLALLCSLSVAAQDIIYSPTKGVREKGEPETVRDTFLAEPGGDATLVVRNGDLDTGKHRVTSALILLDGNTVFEPDDFKKGVFSLEQAVSLQSSNQIEVQLRGKPGSFLTLSVIGELLNRSPVANAGLDQTAFVGDRVQLDGSGSTDADGDLLTFEWRILSRPETSTASLSDPSAPITTFDVDAWGDYEISLVVNDGQVDSMADIVRVSTLNSPPVANAGADQFIGVGDVVTLDGSASSDVDGDPLTYTWSFFSIPDGSSASLSDAAAVQPSFTADLPGVYVVELLVNDGRSDSTLDSVSITTLNSRPVADAGFPQTATVGDTVTLDGSKSTDADGDSLTFDWSLIYKPDGSTAALANPDTVYPTFLVDQAGDFVGQLIVSDGKIESQPATTTITTLPPNHPPVIASAAITEAIAGVPYAYGVEASDPDTGDVLTFTLLTAPQGMSLDGTTGLLQWTPTEADIGAHDVELRVQDQGGLFATQDFVLTVAAANQAPEVISAPVTAGVVGQPYSYDVDATDADGDPLEYALTAAPQGMTIDPVSGLISWTPDAAGDYEISIEVTDGRGGSDAQTFTLSVSAGNGLPPDPATVAPPLDTTVPTSVYDATEFLYTGPDPIQTGVAEGAIESHRAVLLRGKVMTDQGEPLSGVTISILGHPELGQTLSRQDGLFDLVVNGGAMLVVDYVRTDYLPAQRKIEVPWRTSEWLPDVVLKQPDAQVTTVDVSGGNDVQVARGSVVADDDGTRQATMLFPPGTTAELVLPDGSTQAVDTLNVRATEYTVGALGPQAMPAGLPPTTGYTYAVDLSADEAAGRGILFSQPVSYYIENFLDLPVGMDVPVGYYDPDRGDWVPSEDGRIIQILDTSGAIAAIDMDGSGSAADPETLADFGISDAERTQLAALYTAGQSLWRSRMSHFSAWDINLGWGPPPEAPPPNNREPPSPLPEPNSCEEQGSIIECQNQALGETVAVAGTPFTLNYRSNRMPGFAAARSLTIPLSGDTVHPTLLRIDLEVVIAGQRFQESFPAEPNLVTSITWDGKDVYGRPMQGSVPVDVRIGYVYESFYYDQTALAAAYRSFGHSGGGVRMSAVGRRTRSPVTLWKDYQTAISTWDPKLEEGIGGWTLDAHHTYDPAARTLYQGNGRQRRAERLDRVLETVLHTDATAGTLYDIAVDQAGNIFQARGNSRVWKLAPDGTQTVVAGTGVTGYSGDGGPAVEAELGYVYGISVDAAGNLYIADSLASRVRKVDQAGIITTVAGNGTFAFAGNGGPATEASLYNIRDVEVDAEGSLYILDPGNVRVRKVSPDGYILTVAGGGTLVGDAADGQPATEANMGGMTGIALDRRGNLYISQYVQTTQLHRVWRMSADGVLHTLAGVAPGGFSGDNGPATQAQLNLPRHLAVDRAGNVFIADTYNQRVRQVTPSGLIFTVAGNGSAEVPFQNFMPAEQAHFTNADVTLAVDPEDHLLIGQPAYYLWKMEPGSPGVLDPNSAATDDILLVAEDGKEVYVLDASGRHLRTVHPLTGATLYSFAYDAAGRLASIQDGDGNMTRIERDADGNPTAIVAPFGQRTGLGVNADGYLASITNPEGETHQLAYQDAGGLLTRFETPRHFATLAAYDELGRLTRDDDPAGGFKTLQRTDTDDGYEVALTTGEGLVTTYAVDNLANGDQRRITRLPDGTQTEAKIGQSGTTTLSYADGTQVTTKRHPDPRWGMQAPLTDVTITTPGGRTYQATSGRTAVLADPTNLLSLQTQTDSVAINGRVFTSVFDAATRTTTLTTAAGRSVETVLDAQGRTTELAVAGVTPVTYSYDSSGRLAALAQGDRGLRLDYDPGTGFLTALTDALDQVTSLDHDGVGRVTTLTLPDTNTWGSTWDDSGNLSSLLEPDGTRTHAFSYTPIEQLASYTSPLAAIDDFTYDSDRRLTRRENPSGDGTDWTYNALGQLAAETTPEGSDQYTFDAATGLMETATSRDGEQTTYSYDGYLRTALTRSGLVNGTVAFTHDDNLQISQIAYADQALPMTYDADGLLAGVGSIALSRDPQNGLLLQVSDGDFAVDRSYDPFADLQTTSASQGATALYDLSYTYDPLGRIATKTETIGGTTKVWSYTYDAIGQLVEVELDGVVVETYSYDAVGNRVAMTSSLTGQDLPQGSFAYDDDNKLLQAGATTYTYNPDGRLATATTGGETTTYTYNTDGTLGSVQLPSGQKISYLYDDRGRRIVRSVDGVRTHAWLYREGLRQIAEFDGTGNLRQSFVYAGSNTPVRLTRGGQTYHIVSDRLGSPRLVVDDTGGVVKQIDYDSFGQVILDTNPGFDLPFGFAGGLCDGDTGLVRFGAREYDAEMGRWAAKDPILLKGGINVYSYARNDPVTVVDRSGLVTTVIITYDNGFGGHSALHVDNNGSPVLYDPGGSYGDGTRGTQDTFFDNEAALQPFIDFHETTGSRVDIFRFDTSPEEESSLAEAITQQGGMMPGFCAMATCSVLEESNAEEFWDLDGMYIFPGSLADSLRELLDRQGYCM